MWELPRRPSALSLAVLVFTCLCSEKTRQNPKSDGINENRNEGTARKRDVNKARAKPLSPVPSTPGRRDVPCTTRQRQTTSRQRDTAALTAPFLPFLTSTRTHIACRTHKQTLHPSTVPLSLDLMAACTEQCTTSHILRHAHTPHAIGHMESAETPPDEISHGA